MLFRVRIKNTVRRIRQNLMELNQVVCLEYPERDVPWFHEKYCKEKLSLEPQVKDYFFENVSQVLHDILPIKESLKVDCHSPYFHKIDFIIHTNQRGEPVNPEACAPSNMRKIALLLNRSMIPSQYFCGKGSFDLKMRQLELLDYKVIVISKKIWNSMYMAEPYAKEDYLCSEIWPHQLQLRG